ncbi:MAG: hypothetical protein LKG79_10765 [Furfurilactobacillus sp.]|jgi:hypothetical protein|uniref:hypothetical protein n=1 Tax=Furfurilactobacillus sp. TaxID=2767911 RepID=UPI00258C9200|nr:hypothetical protein [Furfurilactobacillus sp.]MCH4010614.1 hypothetical protein [Furfurilactobacillus sp.]MCH4036506.1 hypothetical protein [Furfurilactobacillus sp.]MCH4114548.1 hypothetical protein [Furfurilactobacillus sp.]MCH4134022.1 hypothetical protein [Furfurilactobacillus sp.]MCI1388002.1 hypothetical protein [Furfurilactobacillus sp.]
MAELTDLEKAKAFLADYDGKFSNIADRIGASAQQISNYRVGRSDIASASYAAVHGLAQEYDKWIYQRVVTQPEFMTFLRVMGQWFDDVITDQHELALSDESNPDDEALAAMIQTLNDNVTQNQGLLVNMFSAYVQNLPTDE